MIKVEKGMAMINGSPNELTSDLLHLGKAIHMAKLSKEVSDQLVAAFVLGALTEGPKDGEVTFEELINSDKEEEE